MKKLLSCMFILIFTLGIGTNCFAAKSWNQAEFENFMEYMGYGEINLDEYSFPSNLSKTEFLNRLSRTDLGLTILRFSDSSGDTGFSNTKFTVSFDSIWQFRQMFFNNSYYAYALDPESSYLNQLTNLRFNTETKSVYYAGNQGGKDFTYIPFNWYKKNNNVTEDEWTSEAYKTYLFEEAIIFCDQSIAGTSYIPQGGKITSSSYENKNYQGKILYSSSTKNVSFTFTSGFESNTYYDLFLERYHLDNESSTGFGRSFYPLETIDLGDITTSDSTKSLNIDFALASNNVYRLCIGINNDGAGTQNDVFLSTDWLLPNSNTLGRYPVFARSHYVQFLDLVNYDPEYSEPDIMPDINTGSGDLVYIYGGSALGGFIDSPDKVNLNIKRRNSSIDMSDYYFILDIYDYSTSEIVDSVTIQNSGDVDLWNNIIDEEKLVFFINFSKLYNFNQNINSNYYGLRLHSASKGFVDRTDAFYFNSDWYVESDDDSFIDILKNIPETIIDGIKNLLLPSEGFFSSYFLELNDWFSDRLGMLYFPFDFIISFFNRIYNSEFKEPIIVIPAMQIPLFEEYGNIYDGTTFNFNEFIMQHETFKYIYNLYLVAVDGIIIWGLIRLLLKKYEEVTTNDN